MRPPLTRLAEWTNPEEDLKPNSLVIHRFGLLQNNKIRPMITTSKVV